jgi:lipoyl(octanoyl) transferase
VIEIIELGLKPYSEVWALQKERQRALIDGRAGELLIVCEHAPVITLGKSANESNLLRSRKELARLGVEVYQVERGGDVTYHGPGQLVAYPIFDLRNRKQDVGWYMRTLEEVIIESLKHFEIDGFSIKGKTGVWTGKPEAPRKIASLGVKLSRWCSMHGLSINVRNCSPGFSLIRPCGFESSVMTSMEQERRASFELDQVAGALISEFGRLF